MTNQTNNQNRTNGTEFKYAPDWLKKACKALHFSPTHYEMKTMRNGTQHATAWNSKRTEEFDQALQDYAERYLR